MSSHCQLLDMFRLHIYIWPNRYDKLQLCTRKPNTNLKRCGIAIIQVVPRCLCIQEKSAPLMLCVSAVQLKHTRSCWIYKQDSHIIYAETTRQRKRKKKKANFSCTDCYKMLCCLSSKSTFDTTLIVFWGHIPFVLEYKAFRTPKLIEQ